MYAFAHFLARVDVFGGKKGWPVVHLHEPGGLGILVAAESTASPRGLLAQVLICSLPGVWLQCEPVGQHRFWSQQDGTLGLASQAEVLNAPEAQLPFP